MNIFNQTIAVAFLCSFSLCATAETTIAEVRIQHMLDRFEDAGWTVVAEDIQAQEVNLEIGTLSLFSPNFLISLSAYDLVLEGFEENAAEIQFSRLSARTADVGIDDLPPAYNVQEPVTSYSLSLGSLELKNAILKKVAMPEFFDLENRLPAGLVDKSDATIARAFYDGLFVYAFEGGLSVSDLSAAQFEQTNGSGQHKIELSIQNLYVSGFADGKADMVEATAMETKDSHLPRFVRRGALRMENFEFSN